VGSLRNLQPRSRPVRESATDFKDRNRHGACLTHGPETFMADLLLILATAAFFALCWGYARLCEKL
jgi:hypothetical protein